MSGLEPGNSLGDYKILARIRAGAMGALYLARRPGSDSAPVAIKVIHEHLAQNKRFCRMFIAEAKISSLIKDPHVVRVDEFGESAGRYYLVMEFVHGVSLAQALGILRKRGGLPIDVSVAIAMDVATGLHAAHEATDEKGQHLAIVHRDVSPHNVLVSYDGKVKVIDFGIAKARESAAQTLTGSIRGKLAYMPPEQARSAKHVDRRADLYALGLILWEMLVGRRLFSAKSDIALLNQIRNPTIVPPSKANPRVPSALDAVVMRLLDQDPKKRPATGVEVARLLAKACPTATKVLASDIAAVMKTVRDVAQGAAAPVVAAPTLRVPDETVTSSGIGPDDLEEDEDVSALYGEEVKKEATLFDQGMQAGGSSRDVVAHPLDNDDAPENKTKVMMKPLVRPSAGPLPIGAAPEIRQTFRMDAPPVPAAAPSAPPSAPSSGALPVPDGFDEITKNHKIVPRPSPAAGVPLPLLDIPPPPPSARTPAQPASSGGKLPAWLSAPVLLVLTVVFGALLAVAGAQCSKSGAPSKTALTTTTATTNRPRTPLENAREAAAEGNSAAVRSYLEKGVRGGKATTEEVQLVQGACMQQGDLKCVDQISKQYPSVPRPQSMLPP